MKTDDLILSRALSAGHQRPLATTSDVSRWWPLYWCLIIPAVATAAWAVWMCEIRTFP